MTPPRVLAAAGVSAGGNPGKGANASLRGASGTPPPNGLPGNGRQREPAPHPALRGHLPPRGKARVVIPPGVLAAAEGRGGVGAPRPTDGDMETLRGLRGQPFPGRRTVGAGHARPAGLRGRMLAGLFVGRGLDPSAGGYLGMGVGGRFRGASGTPPPTVCPGKGGGGSLPLIRPCGATFPRGGRQGLQGRDSSLPGKGGSGRPRRGGGTRPTYGGIWKRCGVYVSSRFRAAAR